MKKKGSEIRGEGKEEQENMRQGLRIQAKGEKKKESKGSKDKS